MRSSKAATSVLFPEPHPRLARLVEQGRHLALPIEERLDAVRRLASLSLPVGDPAEMERESVPSPDELLP